MLQPCMLTGLCWRVACVWRASPEVNSMELSCATLKTIAKVLRSHLLMYPSRKP